jgi:hypothetical protein
VFQYWKKDKTENLVSTRRSKIIGNGKCIIGQDGARRRQDTTYIQNNWNETTQAWVPSMYIWRNGR